MENAAAIAAPVVDQVQDNTSAPEGQEQIDASQEAAIDNSALKPAQKVEVKKALKKLKLKVDGREQEVEFDPNDDEFLTRELQKSRAFEKRAQDYSTLEKEVRSFVEELRKNPRKVLSDPSIGLDVKKLAAEIIEEEIANSQKSPELLAKEKLEAELKQMKDEREKEKEESRQKEFDRIKEREFERYDTLMTQALEKTDLPKSPYIVKKMADYLLMGVKAGYDVSPEDVLPLVRQEMQDDLKQMFAVMPDEVIEKIVGKDVFSRIRKKNIARSKAPPTPLNSSIKDTGAKSSLKETKGDKKMSFRDFFGT